MVTVSKEITRLEHSAVKLTLTVAKDEVRSAYNKLMDGYAKSAQIPGFRKGKAPRSVLERKLGEALRTEALHQIMEDATASVFQDEEHFPPDARPLTYSDAKIDPVEELNFEADLVFSLTYDVMPALTLGTWQGLEIEAPNVEIGEEDLQRELEKIQERNATVQDKDDNTPAENGDVATVDYQELTPEGNPAPDTQRQDFTFTLGTGYNIFKFDSDILGMKKGETKDFSKTYPEDFEDADLAGKTKNLRVSLKSLKKKELPVIDDDFAQDVDEKYKTLGDLKTSIRDRLHKDAELRLRAFKINHIMEKIMENSPVDLPESMIQYQLDRHWQNLAQRLNMSVDALKEAAQNEQAPIKALISTWRPETIKALHRGLIMEKIIQELNLQVTEEDIQGHVETLAQNSGMPLEDMQKYYKEGEARQYLEDEVKEDRAYAKILEVSKINTRNTVQYREFAENNG
ncbi:MAG: trigger factor [Spirochaetaceae bacterium]|jgi:trigger factor|nr:trigger factor [Spirochaetaceae bacterium]